VDISVIIPTRERPAKIAECLRHLRDQSIDPNDGLTGRFEVLVGIDGPDPDSARAAEESWGTDPAGAALRVIECPRSGLAAVRNRLLELARGRWILSINDDVYARPGFIATHAREQQRALNRGRPAIIVGETPWRVFPDDSLFDRLVRETSMIFFYDKMKWQSAEVAERPSEGDRDWGFRHCFGLNHSVSAGALKEIGGYAVFPATYGYEDTEAAWRLRERFGMPVLYRPRASAEHDHRYSPRDYLEREEKLGYAAWGFAKQSPACAREMFGHDITAANEIDYSREFVEREAKAAERLRRTVEGLGAVPARAVSGDHAPALINAIYEQHLLLKRWLWRRGLVRAAHEGSIVARAA
jgi:glycosyltransferase involved in cell wall biosynthesis